MDRVAWIVLLVVVVVFALSNRWGPIPQTCDNRPVDLIDPHQELAVADAPGWEYQRTLEADLNGDGEPETIEIIARVLRAPQGAGDYQWDDGQPWQVYIRDGDQTTHVYARWVQLGELLVFVTDDPQPRLVIAESQGAGYALYTVDYHSPGKVKTVMVTSFSVSDRT